MNLEEILTTKFGIYCHIQILPMSSSVLRLGEKIMLPASNNNMNHQFVPYVIVGHDKGCVYHLVAENRFVEPYKRTIVKAKSCRKAFSKAA